MSAFRLDIARGFTSKEASLGMRPWGCAMTHHVRNSTSEFEREVLENICSRLTLGISGFGWRTCLYGLPALRG